MFQQLNAFCDDEEGEDQVKAKALRDRTLYVEPSRTHTNEIKIDGKFKGTGRSARQKEDDKKVIVRFRRWLREQEPPEKQEGDEQGARKPGNDERRAKEMLESNEEELDLTNWEKEKIEKLQKDEQWHQVTRGVKIDQSKSSPLKLPTSNKFSLLSDFPSTISVPSEVDSIISSDEIKGDAVESPCESSCLEGDEKESNCESKVDKQKKDDVESKCNGSKKKKLKKLRERAKKLQLNEDEELFLERAIERAEDERTELAKNDPNCRYKFEVDRREHPPAKPRPSILKRGVRCTLKAARKLRGFVRQALGISKVRFVEQRNTIHHFDKDVNEYNLDDVEDHVEVANECVFNEDTQTEPRTRMEQVLARASGVMNYIVSAILDSGADAHYINEDDRREANMPIVGDSTKIVGVANQGSSKGKHKTKLNFKSLTKLGRPTHSKISIIHFSVLGV